MIDNYIESLMDEVSLDQISIKVLLLEIIAI